MKKWIAIVVVCSACGGATTSPAASSDASADVVDELAELDAGADVVDADACSGVVRLDGGRFMTCDGVCHMPSGGLCPDGGR